MTRLATADPELAAKTLRTQFGACGPPVDVERIAWQMGVHEIVIAPIVGDGKLEQHGKDVRILVQVRASPARRRFTIAHELGHLWLRNQRQWDSDLHAEERFCNAFAAALLMPPDWIGEHGNREDPSLAHLDAIAAKAEVSLAACLLQLRRFAWWRRSLLHWSWDKGNWRLWSTTGVPYSCRRQITTLKKTRAAINLVGKHSEEEPQSRSLWLRIKDEEVEVNAEVKVRRGRALALADLDGVRPPERPNGQR